MKKLLLIGLLVLGVKGFPVIKSVRNQFHQSVSLQSEGVMWPTINTALPGTTIQVSRSIPNEPKLKLTIGRVIWHLDSDANNINKISQLGLKQAIPGVSASDPKVGLEVYNDGSFTLIPVD